MSFDRLLPHFCTIQIPGEEKISEDSWGRPVYEPKAPFQANCRFVEETLRHRDNTGSDVTKELYLLLSSNVEVDTEMTISNIVDNDGNLLTTANLEVDRISRQTARKKLHHFKVYLKGTE